MPRKSKSELPIEGPVPKAAREALSGLVASGLSVKEYSERSGHSYWALRRWRQQYAEAMGLPIQRRPGASKPRGASRIELTQPPVAARLIPVFPTPATAMPESETVQIRLRCDRTLVVPPTIDAVLLGRLVVALERAA